MRRVYVDYDDVLCATAQAITRVLERSFGKRVAFDDIFSFDLGRSFGLPAADLAELMRRVHAPAVLGAMQPIPGALDALQRWADGGREIWVITGRPPACRAASREWLDRHGVPYARLQFVDKYARADGDGAADVLTLAALCRLDFALAVEDAPRMVRALARRTRVPVAMLARPWNAAPLRVDRAAARRVVRCRDWAEVAARFPRP